MESNNCRCNVAEPPLQQQSSFMNDWRSQLQSESRQMIVKKIVEILKRNLPIISQEELQELTRIAVRFEGNVYGRASSQCDYLKRISLKLLTIETSPQNPNPMMPSNSIKNIKGLIDPETWQFQFKPESRQWIVSKIIKTFKVHVPLPASGDPGLEKLERIAVRFEEKTYNEAINQTNYYRKILQKMVAMRLKSQNPETWRSELQPENRQRVVIRIMEDLKVNAPLLPPGDAGLEELKNMAVRFEENIYNEATGLTDYFMQLGKRTVAMSKSQNPNPMVNSMSSNSSGNVKNLVDSETWRSQFQPEKRQRVVYKIVETLEKHFLFSSQELTRISVMLEDKIYRGASDQNDYIRKISIKLLTIEAKSRNSSPAINSMPSNSIGIVENNLDEEAKQSVHDASTRGDCSDVKQGDSVARD